MSSDSLGRVEHLFEEIRKAERTEVKLWDFCGRVAMELLMGQSRRSADGDQPKQDRRQSSALPFHEYQLGAARAWRSCSGFFSSAPSSSGAVTNPLTP